MALSPCPCGGNDYANCCGRYHHGSAVAADAELLMRSRYSAYALKLEAYLRSTWHPDTRPTTLALTNDQTKWLELQIKQHHQESTDSATVEFIAHYKIGGRAQRLHEISRFVREQGCWFYVDGEFPDQQRS